MQWYTRRSSSAVRSASGWRTRKEGLHPPVKIVSACVSACMDSKRRHRHYCGNRPQCKAKAGLAGLAGTSGEVTVAQARQKSADGWMNL